MTKPMLETKVDQLPVTVFQTQDELGRAAAAEAADLIQKAAHVRGEANVILATGNSQLAFLTALGQNKDLPWPRVNVFHLDEYVGLDRGHPASFRNFLHRHFLRFVEVKAFYPISGQAGSIDTTCAEYARFLHEHPADLCVCGYGENGHLAFNDPPFADFNDPVWIKVVRLAQASRNQQVGEGHFQAMSEVPTHAITLTIPAMLAAKRILCLVPEARKAETVHRALRMPVGEDCPGSILRRTPHAHLFLDCDSAARAFQTS
jgi:glucosamine-6-phosphate deaminase